MAAAGEPPSRGDARTEWDRRDREARTKLMEGVLLCLAEEESVVRETVAKTLPSKQWQMAQSNQHPRFHCLREGMPDDDLQDRGFPALVVDFKRYFTLGPEELFRRVALAPDARGNAQRRSVLVSPYLEDAASRFFNFQSRVALPEEKAAG